MLRSRGPNLALALALPLAIAAGCGFEASQSVPGGDDARLADAPPGADDARPIDAAPPIDAGSPDAPAATGCRADNRYITIATSGTASRYRRFLVGAPWTAARQACVADGAHLVIPETLQEGIEVHAFAVPDGAPSPFLWAGVADLDEDETWVDVLGATVTPTLWGSAQPNGGPNNTPPPYAVLIAESGRWFDWAVGAPQLFACECPPP